MCLCVCVFFRENFKSYYAYILRENAKISAVRSLADICSSARSDMVNYVYYLVCLCFGIQLYKCLVHSYSFFGSVNATTHSLISSLA